MSYKTKIVSAVLAIACVTIAHAQSPRPAFEVASVKVAKPDAPYSGNCRGTDFPINPVLPTPGPLGTCVFKGVTLRQLVRIAYRPELQDGMSDGDLVDGAPQWATVDRFEVEGKATLPDSTNTKQLYTMLQELLSDRFQLGVHRGRKDVQGYALVVAKNGPKLKPETSGDEHGSLLPSSRAPFEWEGKNIELSGLANSLSGLFQAPVVDKTGLTGRYTFTLKYAPRTTLSAAPTPLPQALQDIPSIFEALPDQLGLRLEREKVPMEIIVIDSAQKPSEN